MPNAFAHYIFASVVALIFVSMLSQPIELKILSGLTIIATSFLPDLDHEKAVARKVYRKVAGLAVLIITFIVVSRYVNLPMALVLSFMFALILVPLSELLIPHHRGIMHTLEFATIVSLFTYFILTSIKPEYAVLLSISMFIGYTSHIILDKIVKK